MKVSYRLLCSKLQWPRPLLWNCLVCLHKPAAGKFYDWSTITAQLYEGWVILGTDGLNMEWCGGWQRCWGGGGWQVDGRKVCITPGWHHTDTGSGLSCTLSASRTLPASRHHHQASPSTHHRTRCCPSAAAAAYQFTASRLSSLFTNLDWFLVFNKKQSKNNLGCV